MTNDQEDPRILMRSLSIVLNDPNAEWKDIRSAMKAKTHGLKCSTNLAIFNASCSGGVGPGDNDNTAELIKQGEGSRRTPVEVESYSSNRRPSRRASRLVSRKRSSLRWSARSSSASLQSSFNIDDSATSILRGSVNMMDFGVSQRCLAVLDESLRGCALDDDTRSCASLDELDQLKEEFEFDNSDEEGRGREPVGNLDGSIRSEGDLDNYVNSYDGFMNWPSTPQEKEVGGSTLNDPSREDEEGNNRSQTSQEISSSRRPSRRSVRRQSRRHGSHRLSGRSSAGSLGSSFSFTDSLISESGFMGWPSAAQQEAARDLNEDGADANDTIQEEHAEMKREEEEWHIEDYEKSTDDSGPIQHCLSEGSSGSSAFAKTFQLFARVPISNRRASNASSDPCLDGTMDMLKIKRMLLSAKNKEQGVEVEEAEENDDEKKRGGSKTLISMFQQSLAAEMDEVTVEKNSEPLPIASMNDGDNEPTRRRTREDAIWMRHNSIIHDDPDVYKKLYAQPPSEAMPRQSLNIFGRPNKK